MSGRLWWQTHRLLELGSRGADVRNLQQELNAALETNDPITGNFDEHTEKRVKEFQKSKLLVEDGKVGPLTHTVLYQTFYEFSLIKPPLVAQRWFGDRADSTCWAAALQSVLHSSWRAGRQALTRDQIINKYRFLLTNQDGEISLPHFRTLLVILNAHYRTVPGADLRVEWVLRELSRQKHVVIAYKGGGIHMAHTEVIYGVRVTYGHPNFMTMDPIVPIYRVTFASRYQEAEEVTLAATHAMNQP